MVGSLINKLIITLLVFLLIGGLFNHAWQNRLSNDTDRILSNTDAEKTNLTPKTLYQLGVKAWVDHDAAAATFFRRAVSKHIYDIDAWLKLAEVEIALGNIEKAQSMIRFIHNLTKKRSRWKWSETLAAYDLRMNSIFEDNINFMVKRDVKSQNALQLADAYTQYDTVQTIEMLDSENLTPYLLHQMRLSHLKQASLVWKAITRTREPPLDLAARYVHFLVNQKQIAIAHHVWSRYTGVQGVNNPGFETSLTNQGLGWRYRNDSDENWMVERVKAPSHKGDYALQITFNGKKNIAFQHLSQIVAVDPLALYTLNFAWRSENITTDQGPFIEIYDYQHRGKIADSRQITGSNHWRTMSVQFRAPARCHAMVIRLRRLKSKRLDSKIGGVLWLDDFQIKQVG